MRLNLKKILNRPGESIPFSFSMDLSDLTFYNRHPLVAPVLVEGRVYNRAEVLTLEGGASTTLDVLCDRCCQPFSRPLTVSLDTLLATELEDEDSEGIELLDGDELDLGALAHTAVVLAMDSKNLCSEDCKGLCSGCGVNLNEVPCRCKREVDPRMAALAQLLDRDLDSRT